MIAFDSNVLIYHLEKNRDFATGARAVFLRIQESGGACSSLVITEAFGGSIDSFAQMLPLFSPSIKILPLDVVIAERAGQVRLAYDLSNADAIHLATALESGANEFVTNDQALLKKKIPGIKIRGL